MKVRDPDVLAWARGLRKMSEELGAFGIVDFSTLRPVLAWRGFWNLRTVYFFNILFFSCRGKPRVLNQWIREHGRIFIFAEACSVRTFVEIFLATLVKSAWQVTTAFRLSYGSTVCRTLRMLFGWYQFVEASKCTVLYLCAVCGFTCNFFVYIYCLQASLLWFWSNLANRLCLIIINNNNNSNNNNNCVTLVYLLTSTLYENVYLCKCVVLYFYCSPVLRV
jgi:hypothetical protein